MRKSISEQERYDMALKRVKKIKGFYTHAAIYVVINIMIVIINIQNLEPGESYFHWYNFTTLFFWGVGLTAHAASVFVPEFIFGKNWEERKIKEFMEKERQQNKWE
jgi:uncharacterized NAD(P)/FAD-binding protein YdhS